jgi:hypothetical protein
LIFWEKVKFSLVFENYIDLLLWTKQCCVGDPGHFGAAGFSDLYLWQTDPDPTPDPTPFFSHFSQDEKKVFFHIFFILVTSRNIIFSLRNLIFCENFVLKFYFSSIISVRSTPHLYEKTEGSGTGAGSGSVPLTNESGSGMP